MPTTFSEILPAQASSPHNGLRWTPNPLLTGTGFLVIFTGKKAAEYLLAEFSTPWDGRAFHLAKTEAGTDLESYDVFCGRNGQDRQCSCKGFAYGRGRPCKHILAVEALLENEELWNRSALANPEADASNTEAPF